eukprot:535050-Amphidinium_carterae.1
MKSQEVETWYLLLWVIFSLSSLYLHYCICGPCSKKSQEACRAAGKCRKKTASQRRAQQRRAELRADDEAFAE